MRRFLLILMLFIPQAAGAGAESLIAVKAPDFTLQDQHGVPFSLRETGGRPLVLIASDREGAKQNPAWRKAVVERYGGRVLILGIADVRKAPFFLKSSVTKDFQKDRARILLDWDGAVFSSYGLLAGVTNIVLIDGKGLIRYRCSGSHEQDASERLFRELDQALK